MRTVDVYLEQLDHAWDHKWESLTAALEGVTEEEAAFQSPCYAAEEPEEGWPAPGTVLWQIAHVAHCKRHYADILRSLGAPARPPVAPRSPCATLADERAALAEAHAGQRAAIAALDDTQLDASAGGGMSVREFLAMCIRHDTWHASQVAVVRRLFRTR